MDLLPALETATDDFTRLVRGVTDDAWSAPSPCEGWDVRTVVNHVVAGNLMAARLLDGAAKSAAIAGLFDTDLLGADVEAAVARSGEEQLAAFRRPQALEMTVHHPAGDLPATMVLGFRLGDVLVHGWDVARGSGQVEELDTGAVEALWSSMQPVLPLMAARGVFGAGASGTVPDDAPLQVRLLDAMGRRP